MIWKGLELKLWLPIRTVQMRWESVTKGSVSMGKRPAADTRLRVAKALTCISQALTGAYDRYPGQEGRGASQMHRRQMICNPVWGIIDWMSRVLVLKGHVARARKRTNRTIDLPRMTAIDSVAWLHVHAARWLQGDAASGIQIGSLGELLGGWVGFLGRGK